MKFVDKNPEGLANAPPLDDQSEWEHRVIINVAWWRSHGYAVLTKLINASTDQQTIEKYLINDSLHQMIRDSSHNVKIMASRMNVSPAPAAAAPAPGPTPTPGAHSNSCVYAANI